MKNIDILIVVDTLGALSSGNLGDNVYLIDTNKHFGSGGEGQTELKTACQDGQILRWRVQAVSPANDAEIVGFTGDMITKKVCTPAQQGLPGDTFWEGRVESQGAKATFQYSVQLSFDGRQLTFDPYLVVTS